MNKQYLVLVFCLGMIFTCPNSALAQDSAVECRQWEGSLPCDLLIYQSLVDPATLQVAPVAVAMHIVRYSDSSGGFQGDLSGIVNMFNAKFASARLTFLQLSLDYIDSDYFASQNPPYTSTKEDELSATYNVSNAVNIYFVPEYSGATGTFTPDVMAYLGRSKQSIITSHSNAISGNSLYHEMGHYFNLLHTFENGCSNPTPAGNCLISPSGTGNTTGDLVDDTAPDPYPGYNWVGCQYVGPPAWCPDGTNLMSYAFDCRTSLTIKQIRRVRTTYEEKRPELQKWLGRFTNKIGSQNAGGSFLVDGQVTVPSGSYYELSASGSHNARTQNERFIDFGGSTDYKHHDWQAQLTDFRLLHSFVLPTRPVFYPRDANFVDMNPCTIRTEFVDGGLGDKVKFRDPWRLHSDGTQPDALLTLPSPYNPTGAYNQNAGGVFLRHDPQLTPTYYSVGAESPWTLSGFESYFIKWSGSYTTFQDSFALNTPVVFTNSGATATAKYKAHLGSSSGSSTGTNSQRKMVSDGNGSYYLTYTSANEVWFTQSSDGGSTWSAEVLLSDNTGHSSAPSIALGDDNEAYVVFRKQTSSQYDIQLRIHNAQNGWGNWEAPITINTTGIALGIDPHPVVARNNAPNKNNNYSIPQLYVFYENREWNGNTDV